MDPGRELSETLVRVLRQNLPAPPAPRPAALTGVPAQLPPAAAGFVGREGPLAELDAMRRSGGTGSVVISALDGLGGIGKTALAVQWAHRVAAGYPDGQLHADLRGHAATEPVRPVEVLGRFLRALGVPANQVPTGTDEAAALYRSLPAGRRMLILLDNAADADQVRPLLPGDAGCLVVVTSRARLDGLRVRDGARQVTLRVLDTVEAVELLASVAGERRMTAEPEAAAELVALCGYLSLALRIVGAQLAADPALTLAAQLAALREDRWAELALPAARPLRARHLRPVLPAVGPGGPAAVPAARPGARRGHRAGGSGGAGRPAAARGGAGAAPAGDHPPRGRERGPVRPARPGRLVRTRPRRAGRPRGGRWS